MRYYLLGEFLYGPAIGRDYYRNMLYVNMPCFYVNLEIKKIIKTKITGVGCNPGNFFKHEKQAKKYLKKNVFKPPTNKIIHPGYPKKAWK